VASVGAVVDVAGAAVFVGDVVPVGAAPMGVAVAAGSGGRWRAGREKRLRHGQAAEHRGDQLERLLAAHPALLVILDELLGQVPLKRVHIRPPIAGGLIALGSA